MITEARKTRGIIRQGTRANQPAATDVLWGTLYYVTDEGITERSDGVSWWGFSSNINLPIAQSDVTGLVADLATKLESPIAQSDVTDLVSDLADKIDLNSKVNITYAAGNFTAPGGATWTVDAGDIETYAYILLGNIILFFYGINTASTSGNPTQLRIQIPFTATATTQNLGRYYDAVLATGGVLNAVIANASNLVLLIKLDGTAWGNGTNHHYVFGFVPVFI